MDHSIAQDSDADEEEEELNGLVSVRSLSVVDDWEDSDYNERIQAHYSSTSQANTLTATASSTTNDDDDYYDNDEEIHLPTNSTNNTTNNDTIIKTEYDAEVEANIWDRLYDYQKDGCKWLYRLYRDGAGGILVRIYNASIIFCYMYNHQY